MCADPGIPLFGGRTLEGLIYQNRVDWTCDNGYVMDGQPSAICTAAGTWTNPVPVCERECGLSDEPLPVCSPCKLLWGSLFLAVLGEWNYILYYLRHFWDVDRVATFLSTPLSCLCGCSC